MCWQLITNALTSASCLGTNALNMRTHVTSANSGAKAISLLSTRLCADSPPAVSDDDDDDDEGNDGGGSDDNACRMMPNTPYMGADLCD